MMHTKFTSTKSYQNANIVIEHSTTKVKKSTKKAVTKNPKD